MRSVFGSIFVAAVSFSSHVAVASSDCAPVAEFVKRAEALFEQDRGQSVRSIMPYRDLTKETPIFRSCSLQEIKEEISKSKFLDVSSESPQSPDIWTFSLSDGIVAVGFAYFISQQTSKFHYSRWKHK